mmetsp:Transcript_10559/g.24829  ORF Transcript_10559/g.24829 Transcript_10559/m.24829 type:complete len:236 (-) Transcript_10559:253-960(-)
MTDTKSTARVPTFDGTGGKYLMWCMSIKATGRAQGWRQALEGEANLPTTIAEVAAATGDALEAAERNNKAAAALTIAMDGNVAMYSVLKAGETEAFPDGEAHLIWKALEERFAPKDDLSPVEMEVDLANLTWKKDENPDKFHVFVCSGSERHCYSSSPRADDNDERRGSHSRQERSIPGRQVHQWRKVLYEDTPRIRRRVRGRRNPRNACSHLWYQAGSNAILQGIDRGMPKARV